MSCTTATEDGRGSEWNSFQPRMHSCVEPLTMHVHLGSRFCPLERITSDVHTILDQRRHMWADILLGITRHSNVRRTVLMCNPAPSRHGSCISPTCALEALVAFIDTSSQVFTCHCSYGVASAVFERTVPRREMSRTKVPENNHSP